MRNASLRSCQCSSKASKPQPSRELPASTELRTGLSHRLEGPLEPAHESLINTSHSHLRNTSSLVPASCLVARKEYPKSFEPPQGGQDPASDRGKANIIQEQLFSLLLRLSEAEKGACSKKGWGVQRAWLDTPGVSLGRQAMGSPPSPPQQGPDRGLSLKGDQGDRATGVGGVSLPGMSRRSGRAEGIRRLKEAWSDPSFTATSTGWRLDGRG